MDLRQLTYFLAAAEEGQITKAAKRLNVTQPPLSQQLILLEKEIGSPLFERSKKGVTLTETGTVLQRRAQQMMALLAETVNELNEVSTGVSGRLTIGAISTASGWLLPRYIQKFHQQYPKVTFQLRQGESLKILEMLDTGLIELGLVRFPVDYDRYDFIKLPEEDMIAAGLPSLLPAAPPALSLTALADTPLLIHQRYAAALTEHCQLEGFVPNILCTSDDITPLLQWANQGLGLAIVPQTAGKLLSASGLFCSRLTCPALKTTSAIVWSKKHRLSCAAQHFIAMFQALPSL